MANHASAKKRVRRNQKHAEVNKSRRSRIRTFVKKVEAAISAKDADTAKEALKVAQPELQKGAAKGILHKNVVARKLSRLSARIKAI
ncbi:MAG: 30S ribosomal protein S20 [Alphaproteobacteria bacterium]|nr:30S ribosomal protein S20 [Alphaproteobacteria bacterium]